MLSDFIHFIFTIIDTHLPQNTYFIKINTDPIAGPKYDPIYCYAYATVCYISAKTLVCTVCMCMDIIPFCYIQGFVLLSPNQEVMGMFKYSHFTLLSSIAIVVL
jgi:hypothetical protein